MNKEQIKDICESFNITYYDKEGLSIKEHCDMYLHIKKDILKILRNYPIKFVLADTELTINYTNSLKKLQQENKELKEQLKYLRSGSYLNQVKWERSMLEQQYLENKEINIFDNQSKTITNLQSRIDKAIEKVEDIITEFELNEYVTNFLEKQQDVLLTLKGDSN